MVATRRVRIVPIWASGALAEVLRDVVREEYAGSLSAAARDAGVSRPTFDRLVKRTRRGCHPKVFDKIRRIVPSSRRARFDEALLGPVGSRTLRLYDRWLEDQLVRVSIVEADRERLLRRFPIRKRMTLAFLHKSRFGRRPRWQRVERVLSEMKERFPQLFEDFDQFLTESHHFKGRCRLALSRVVDPLVDAEDSGYMERSWQEMEPEELQGFLKARMKSERVLLNRCPDVQRAQATAKEEARAIRDRRSTD